MSAIGVGDVVVCVDADACPVTGVAGPRLGLVYRVTDARHIPDYAGREIWCVQTDRHNPVRADGVVGWSAAVRFRKIDAADDAFTASIRRRQPVEA
jgi:hypothetical protein